MPIFSGLTSLFRRAAGNVFFLGLGIILLGISVWLRFATAGKLTVGVIDLVLLALPILLWLLASGQLESLKIGSSGFQVKTVIQSAAARPASFDIKPIDIEKIDVASKGDVNRLQVVKLQHPKALTFVVRRTENGQGADYYEEYALSDYISQLSGQADFKYFLFFGSTPSQPFLGGIGSGPFCRSIHWPGFEPDAPLGSITLQDLAAILNGKGDFQRIRELQGFVGIDRALKKKDDTKTALSLMDEMGTAWLPVVERFKFIGVVEQASLVANLLLDISNALTGSAPRRAKAPAQPEEG